MSVKSFNIVPSKICKVQFTVVVCFKDGWERKRDSVRGRGRERERPWLGQNLWMNTLYVLTTLSAPRFSLFLMT